MRSFGTIAAAAIFCVAQPLAAQPSKDLIDRFSAAANAYTTCLAATVQMGMITKMDPEVFKEGFAKSCMDEEVRFKDLAVEVSIAAGQPEDEAKAEIDANIVKGRAIYASDQELYITTGRIPR